MVRALRYFAALTLLALPTFAQGPVVLMGIDAEDNNPPQHGGIAPYVDVIDNGVLPNVTNGGSGLLVIGGGKDVIPPVDDVTNFWNLVASGLGVPVTYRNGAAAITSGSFSGFAVIAIASSAPGTPSGGLTSAESTALNGRAASIAAHVNGGGGLFGTSQSGLPTPYGYLGAIGSFTFSFGGFAQVTATPEGEAVGITDTNMDVSAWHDRYLTFPSFLDILATDDATGKACALGGAEVCIPCSITCPPNVTIPCTASTAPSNTGTATGCAGATFTDTVTAGNCAGNYVITRHWSAPDGCGDTAMCDQTITVTDTIGPTITCPANVGVDCAASTAPSSTGTATATDDCSGVASITHSDSTAPGGCAGNYVITRTWTASDHCGNSSSCTQTITVTDTTGPTLTCPANVGVDCAASTAPSNTGTATATDDCSGVASIGHSDSTAAGGCAGNYVITRTWTASDNCGNSSSCTQTITVTDTTAPTITCPGNVGVDCAASTAPSNTGTATATDDCSGVASIGHSDSTAPGGCAGSYVITRTWTASDNCGNSSSCTQTITVTDTTAPTITCPGNVSLDCAASTDPGATGSATATDDCSGVASIGHSDSTSGSCAGTSVITRTWTATDTCGNSSSCTQTITVTDTTGPTLTCPADVGVDCAASTDPGATGSATATDDCSGVAGIGHSDSTAAGSCAGSYVITRTWTATDGCGNSSSCAQTITVTDTTGPTLTCPADVGVDCSASTDPSDTGSATATDDCSSVAGIGHSDSTAAGGCAGSYVITRTWTATDSCGNSSSCAQTITVTDTTGPTLTCPADVGVDCSASTDPSDTGSATATDDCSGVAGIGHSDSTAAGGCAGSYVITRTWTATDSCGNSSSCAQTITVTDTTGPTLTCPADVGVDCSASTDPSDTGSATATDDCSGVAGVGHSDSTAAGGCAGNYVITRTWTATDTCGNSSSCTQTITVTDTTGPTLTCPASVGVDCSAPTDPSDTGSATAADDCSGVAGIGHSDSTAAGDCAGNYVITRTWTATDNCGNSSSCTQTITVTDTTPPTITCPPDVTLTACCVSGGVGMATAIDDCSNATVTSDAPTSFCIGDTVVTWTATDDCGNSSTCQQLVTVEDVTLDFETDGGGNPLLHGQSLVTAGPEVPYSCPSISGGPDSVSPGNGNNGAAIFDSTSGPFGQDPDLHVDLGNILYFQRNGGPTDDYTGFNGPDTWDHPNDDEDGGTLTFDFCGGVEALSIDLIDIDIAAPSQDASVVLTDANLLTRTYTVPAGWTANGPGALAVGTLVLNAAGSQPGVSSTATESTQPGYDETNVVKIVVRLGSSGAVDNLHYCPGVPRASATMRNGSGINQVSLTSVSLPVLGETWLAELDCTAFGSGPAILSLRGRPTTGTMTQLGELLVAGDFVRRMAQVHAGTVSQFFWDIPDDLTLVGVNVYVQGQCSGAPSSVGPKAVQLRGGLSNAVDLVLGF